MANSFIPEEIDFYFFLDSVLIFLMINYSMPLSAIYSSMVILGAFMYYVAMDQRVIQMIPFFRRGNNEWFALGIGIALGFGFIWFYNYLGSVTSMSAVFATTAFGESETIGKLVFGILIPVAETRFFFRSLWQWFVYKTGASPRDLFNISTIVSVLAISGIFTLFHATAKGLTNTPDLIATFAFAILSIVAIIIFQQLTEATVLHIYVNSFSVGLFDLVKSPMFYSSPYVWLVAVGFGYYLWKAKKIPILTG